MLSARQLGWCVGLALGACGDGREVDTVTITGREVWANERVVVTGTLTVASGGELVLDHCDLDFAPRVEDSDTFLVAGTGRVSATASHIGSSTGRQWNLQAPDAAAIMFDRTTATGHSGLRMFGTSRFTASGDADVEEVQVHDDASVTLQSGAHAYIVLDFSGAVVASLVDGELGVGTGLTRTFAVATGPGRTGHVALTDAEVYGWQLDLEDTAQLAIAGGGDIVLAMHLHDVVRALDADLTSDQPTSGAVDFSPAGPRLTFSASRITSLNLYTQGACDLSFTGAVDVTEPNAGDTSRVVFGPRTRLWANLAQTYDDADMRFDRVTLREDESTAPSFTAQDTSRLRIDGVAATARTRVAAVGAGRVLITGGSGWTADKLEAIDPEGEGGVYVDGIRVAP